MHTPEIQAAIDLLKQSGFKVIRGDRVTTINATLIVDDMVFGAARYPPEHYINRELALHLAHELIKVWELEKKELKYEEQTEYRATVTVVKP
jgi:hypothetical protein